MSERQGKPFVKRMRQQGHYGLEASSGVDMNVSPHSTVYNAVQYQHNNHALQATMAMSTLGQMMFLCILLSPTLVGHRLSLEGLGDCDMSAMCTMHEPTADQEFLGLKKTSSELISIVDETSIFNSSISGRELWTNKSDTGKQITAQPPL
jgi:hypothetical protein